MRARQTQCMGNLKQISGATHVYIEDNSGFIPYAFLDVNNISWDDLLGIGRYDGRDLTWADASAIPLPFHRRTTNLYMCPEHIKNDSSRRSYSIVSSHVAGSVAAPGNPENTHGIAFRGWSMKLSRVPEASRTLMYAERPADQCGPGAELVIARSHMGRHIYVFVDGHLETHFPMATINPQGGTMENPKGIWTWTRGD